jgi:hypothetical protein
LRTEKRLWWIAVVACTVAALWPIWSARFPPMQDYAGQLFYSEVLRLHGDPASDYDRYYEFRFHPVYATFYLTTLAFAKLVPIEIAGKLSLSLYPLLVAALALRLGRRAESTFVPWGALLLFPFAFNQQYFYGNVNYLLSLPILLLALLDFETFLGAPLSPWPVARHVLWQIVLVVTHPLSFAVFVAMAIFVGIVGRRPSGRPWARIAVAAGIAVVLLAALRLGGMGTTPSNPGAQPGNTWMPPAVTLGFFALMFDGMQPLQNANREALLLWGGVLAIAAAAGAIAWRTRSIWALPWAHVLLLVFTVVAMFVLPFQIGEFSYINVRFAALAYFLVALCAAQIRFPRPLAFAFVGLVVLAQVDSIAKQARISAESAELLPVARAIAPHSRVLPLVFDPGSPELDKFWFAPHVQEYNYVHLVGGGGGFNPYLFGSPIDPVRPKPGEERPAPPVGRPDEFTWEQHAADYQYFLVQGAPGGLPEYLGLHCKRVASSGKWLLFAR